MKRSPLSASSRSSRAPFHQVRLHVGPLRVALALASLQSACEGLAHDPAAELARRLRDELRDETELAQRRREGVREGAAGHAAGPTAGPPPQQLGA